MYFRASANDAAPMSESELYPAIIGTYSKGDTRLFRINSGLAWQGQVIEHTARRLILLDPRPVKLGVPGMSDLIGWTTEGGPGYEWPRHAVFCAVEVKGPRTRTTREQAAFIDLVTRHGGRAGIARSVEEAGLIIQGGI